MIKTTELSEKDIPRVMRILNYLERAKHASLSAISGQLGSNHYDAKWAVSCLRERGLVQDSDYDTGNHIELTGLGQKAVLYGRKRGPGYSRKLSELLGVVG